MTRQITIHLSDDLISQIEIIARTRGISMNSLVVEFLASEVTRTGVDQGFREKALQLLERDQEIIKRLGNQLD